MTLYQTMNITAKSKPTATAIVFYSKRYTFQQILKLTNATAIALKQQGIQKGDTVTLCMPNTPSAQIAFYALNKIGAIVNLVHPRIPPTQLSVALKETKSKMLITFDLYSFGFDVDFSGKIIISKCGFFMGTIAKTALKIKTRNIKLPNLPILEDVITNVTKKSNGNFAQFEDGDFARFEDDEVAVLLPSGGTTGTPKIVAHPNRTFIDLCNHAQFFLSGNLSDYHTMYTVLPIFHGFGLCMNMHMCIQRGFTNVMSIKFDPKHLAKSIKKEGINIIMGVPSMFDRLILSKDFNRADLSSLKECFVGGDCVNAKTVESFDAILAKQNSTARLHIGYGLTETVAVCTVNTHKFNKKKSAGLPLPNCKIKILNEDLAEVKPFEVGEIAVNSPIMMLGYSDSDFSPIKTIDGLKWLLTGDLGYVDQDGFLFFVQRKKNMLKVSGVPVFPSQIEELVRTVKGVKDVVAVGIPDRYKGEVVKLFVVADATADKESLKAEIKRICTWHLICYAIPKRIEFIDKLPLNSVGKIDINALKNRT